MKALIFNLRTISYTNQELASMSIQQQRAIRSSGYKKVIGEEIIEEIETEDTSHLRNRVIEICEKHPSPIIVNVVDGLWNYFLLNRIYKHDDSRGILELILYYSKTPRPDMGKMSHEEFKAYSKEESRRRFLRSTGFTSVNEYEAFLKGIEQELESGDKTVSTEEKFELINKRLLQRKDNKYKTEIVEDTIFLVDPAAVIDEDTTVIARIIGKEENKVYTYAKYYLDWHNISRNQLQFTSNSFGKSLRFLQ